MYGAKFESVEEYKYQESLKPYYESPYYQEGVFTFEQKLELASLLNTVHKVSLILFILLGSIISGVFFNILSPLLQVGGDWLWIISLVVLLVSFFISNKTVSLISDWYIKSKISEFRLANLEQKTKKVNSKINLQPSP